MTEKTAIFTIIFGIFAIASGIWVKTFYVAKGMFGAMESNRQVARWKGRLFLLIAGTLLLLTGIQYFMFGK
jgi:hypothetical protein